MVRKPLKNELALLGFFHNQPRYGYEIYQLLRQPGGLSQVWRMKQSHLYAMLDRLEGDGLLSSHLEFHENRPARKLFSLTDTGHSTFTAWLVTPVDAGRDMRQEFQLKLYFASTLAAEKLRILITDQKRICERWSTEIQNQLMAVEMEGGYNRMVLRYRIYQIGAMIAWLDECLVSLATKKPEQINE